MAQRDLGDDERYRIDLRCEGSCPDRDVWVEPLEGRLLTKLGDPLDVGTAGRLAIVPEGVRAILYGGAVVAGTERLQSLHQATMEKLKLRGDPNAECGRHMGTGDIGRDQLERRLLGQNFTRDLRDRLQVAPLSELLDDGQVRKVSGIEGEPIGRRSQRAVESGERLPQPGREKQRDVDRHVRGVDHDRWFIARDAESRPVHT